MAGDAKSLIGTVDLNRAQAITYGKMKTFVSYYNKHEKKLQATSKNVYLVENGIDPQHEIVTKTYSIEQAVPTRRNNISQKVYSANTRHIITQLKARPWI